MHATDPVNRIMSEPVLSVGPDESVRDMLQYFVAYPVHHLPVVKDNQVVGMISSADLMKLEFFLPPPGPARDKLLNDRFKVSNVMRTPVVTVTEHETVQRAAELLAKSGFHCLPVVNTNDHLIGIVTTTDLMHHCLMSGDSNNVFPTQGSGHFKVIDARYTEILAKARNAVDSGNDPDGIASALLHMQQRLSALENVAFEAKRYINAGQDERLHATLRKAIDRADRVNGVLGKHSTASGMLGLGAEN
jgi:CBS domain-containing membrane protein